jgi:hypothetical protein
MVNQSGRHRSYAIRNPKDYMARTAGDIVEVDTTKAHTEEFYEVTDTSFEIAELNQALLKWEKVYNTVRPHQALGDLTPQEFLKYHQQNKRKGGEVSLII